MNRRRFGLVAMGAGAAARSAGQAPGRSQVRPLAGSLKEKIYKGEPTRTLTAPIEFNRGQLEEIIRKNGKVDLFSVDGQHRPLPDERDLARFCKLAEELGAGVQLRIPHPRQAYLTGRFADLGVLSIMVPLVEEVETAREPSTTSTTRRWATGVGAASSATGRSRRWIASSTRNGGTARASWGFRSRRSGPRSMCGTW